MLLTTQHLSLLQIPSSFFAAWRRMVDVRVISRGAKFLLAVLGAASQHLDVIVIMKRK